MSDVKHELETRQKIARLLTHRCNNCYRRLPGAVGCSVHSKGWNWLTDDFGPFCDDCIKEIVPEYWTRFNG